MNKQQLQQEIEALQKQLEEKQKALAAMPEKWEPKGGGWGIDCGGEICDGESYPACASFGTEYATRQQAGKAAKAMRAHNRLLAWASEFAQYYGFQEGVANWFVCYDYDFGGWMADYTYDMTVGVVYLPEMAARLLASKLNSGEVEL